MDGWAQCNFITTAGGVLAPCLSPRLIFSGAFMSSTHFVTVGGGGCAAEVSVIGSFMGTIIKTDN